MSVFLRNENITNTEHIVKEAEYQGRLSGHTQTITEFDCFMFSFMKISIATSQHIKLRLIWKPSKDIIRYTHIDHFDDPSNAVFATNHRSTKTSLIDYETDNKRDHEIQKNKYKLLVVPIEGEICEIKVIREDNTLTNEEQGFSMRVCLSNNFHYVANE
ncbi:hypothetical protein [Phenylobacterium sp.]|jgi:hypothetical protein|uniref:hypothetical protein n=1 Tax=Phenylobacterium sp. TaxID=1871053 RepID=UPI0025E5656B|nr:hypothetical protein [Phenylobacterium sp.]